MYVWIRHVRHKMKTVVRYPLSWNRVQLASRVVIDLSESKTQIFSFTHSRNEIMRWEENLGFHAILQNLGWKWVISQNHAGKIWFSRIHAEISCFSRITHGSHFPHSRRFFFRFHAFTQKKRSITQSRRPMGSQLKCFILLLFVIGKQWVCKIFDKNLAKLFQAIFFLTKYTMIHYCYFQTNLSGGYIST